MGTVVTFYSYKGGVGRTMALANVAILLAKWGKKVLIIDWDLEAPGVEHFFKEGEALAEIQQRKGLIELLTLLSESSNLTVEKDDWQRLVTEISIAGSGNPIHLLTAGGRTPSYFGNVRKLDVKKFYEDQNGGHIIEALRNSWKSSYDFVLVDSRTGITDIGGICTIQLPDVLALVFTATRQSLDGAVSVALKAFQKRQELPFDRALVPVIPLPSRFDTQTEHEIAQKWLGIFDDALAPLYNQWLPRNIVRRDFLSLTKIPYTAYFSFGEGLPVVEPGTTDPTSLGYAYETVAALIANNLQHADLLASNSRDEFVQLARSPERLPKIPLRALPGTAALLIDLVGASSLRKTFDREKISSKDQEETWHRFHRMVGDAAKRYRGELAESDGESFLFVFQNAEDALRSALCIQELLAIKRPIASPMGALQIRMAVHASPIEDVHFPEIKELRDIATLILAKAPEGEILVSEKTVELLHDSIKDVQFRPTTELEIIRRKSEGKVTDVTVMKLFKAVSIVKIDLTADESRALFGQDPGSKSGGGFQALLVNLQERLVQSHLELTVSDRERIARYAHDYKGGGWQGRLRRIFGRTLGDNLGREIG